MDALAQHLDLCAERMAAADLERWFLLRRRLLLRWWGLLFISLRMRGQGREAERGDKDQGDRGGADRA